jgi:DNA-binding CsgD family transcriptional regulator
MSALILPAQLPLFSGTDEASLYHPPSGGGFFSLLLQKGPGQAKFQRSYKLRDMPQVLELIDYSKDSWISQAEFALPNRRVVNLSRVGLLFIDLDTYKSELMKTKNVEEQIRTLHFFCDDLNIPRPSLVVFSGRGLQAKWLLQHALPRAALPRWNACQKVLVEALAPLGADGQARDASRVLRLVQSVHSGSGERVHVVDVQGIGLEPIQYEFDAFADQILPLTRDQIHGLRADRKLRDEQRAERKQLQLIRSTSPKAELFKGYNGRTLAWHRLEDLRKLGQLRGGWVDANGVSTRTKALHWQMNFLCLSGAANPSTFHYEAKELAKQIDKGWNFATDELSTLRNKAQAYAEGQGIEFGGRKWPALYTPKNQTLIDLFEITEAEQRQLRTIVSKGEATRRDTARQMEKRRAAGVQERSIYLGKAAERHAEIRALKAQGLSAAVISKQLGISSRTVFNALKTE